MPLPYKVNKVPLSYTVNKGVNDISHGTLAEPYLTEITTGERENSNIFHFKIFMLMSLLTITLEQRESVWNVTQENWNACARFHSNF